jgi:SHS2 domain-containing protein
MRERYRYVEHTADVEFVAYGAGMDELFRNALLAMFDTAADIRKLAGQRRSPVKFSLKEDSNDTKDLLWLTLQDSLSKASAKGIFAYGVSKLNIKETKRGYALEAVILGRKETPGVAKLDVKGVSKYDLNINRIGRHFEASVVLDV